MPKTTDKQADKQDRDASLASSPATCDEDDCLLSEKITRCKSTKSLSISLLLLCHLALIQHQASAASTLQMQEDDLIQQASQLYPKPTRYGGNSVWSDIDGWQRNKRRIGDRPVLASRRAAAAAADEELELDDGNEDAWVHDGIDDIHIDPETKKAASELNQDESSSIDAEYEPQGDGDGAGQDSEPVVTRTGITTIQEVIPMNTNELESTSGPSGSPQQVRMIGASIRHGSGGPLLPASYLTLNQIQQLLASQRRADDSADDKDTAPPPPGSHTSQRRANDQQEDSYDKR